MPPQVLCLDTIAVWPAFVLRPISALSALLTLVGDDALMGTLKNVKLVNVFVPTRLTWPWFMRTFTEVVLFSATT